MALFARLPLSPRARAARARGQVTLSLTLLSAAGLLVGALPTLDWTPLAALGLAGGGLFVLILGIVNLLRSRRP